ncbi:Beta-xylosidase [Enterococcus mundtii 3F]|uniref:glycoside hydrolase family 43 protein n=1 Tax=Enterococcus mundtii TaxID=53346 RepID=UPI002302E87A|nr:glycoside hydrolase family 43 protein [Enterococcus mundtii]MDA9461179.1 Beta-xylosidase [Enterococcus mundtii 3F]
MKIKNPVLTGFHADPSIVRVGETYYIANSTFEWFPGVQIYESQDLMNWRLVARPLASVEMLDMKGNEDSGGIWAPDLSYADGKFWLVYTDVKVVNGAFKDCTNYLTTAEKITGPWSQPIRLNGVGFDASLFHDDDGRKYLVQMEWDHREYHHPFNGIKCTEYSVEEQRLLPETGKIIWKGTDVKLVEGPHLYKLFGYYYLFCAEGGTVYTHQEVVARSKTLEGAFESQAETFLTAYDSPENPLQKCGHGALVDTPEGEWYFAHLTGRPWHHKNESIHDPRGWCTLGRETAIQKVIWSKELWPEIVGGKQGSLEVEAPKGVTPHPYEKLPERTNFEQSELPPQFQTVRVPFTENIGILKDGKLTLRGAGSLANTHGNSLVARRWQAFEFEAETALSYSPTTFQQMAGLTNYYNSQHWSMIQVTWQEEKGRVIELTENNQGVFKSYLQEQVIPIPEDVIVVYFKTIVRRETYTYAYSFDGKTWIELAIQLDAKVLSDEYVNQTHGGFFTGAFVGMVNIDYSGYDLPAVFDYFDYRERQSE